MTDIIQISTPFTENWVAWTMLLLILLLGMVCIFEPGMYRRAFLSLPTVKERDSIFAGSGSDTRTRVALTAYDILLLGITLQWACCDGQSFSFITFLILSGMSAAMMLLRYILQRIVAYTFFTKEQLESFTRHYHYLRDCTMLILYPITLVALFGTGAQLQSAMRICIIVLLAVALCFLLYKLLASFQLKPGSLLFLPLYLITVEIIPVVALIGAALTLL